MPIFPVPSPCGNRQKGFTLTETIIALAIVTLLAGTTASALIRSLQSEEIGYMLLRGVQVLQTIDCESWLGTSQEDILEMLSEEWVIDFSSIEFESLPQTDTSWTVCRLHPRTRPALEMKTVFPNR